MLAGRSMMYNKDRLIRQYEDKSYAELAAAPVYALQGLSENDAKLLEDAFCVKTVRDLANLKYARWAREIVELAETGIKNYNIEYFEDKLVKKYEKKSPEALVKSPMDALQGLSNKDALRLQKAFNLKTIGDLAELKYVFWALEIVNGEKYLHEDMYSRRRRMSLIAKFFIIACFLIIAVVFIKRFIPHLKTIIANRSDKSQKVSMQKDIVKTTNVDKEKVRNEQIDKQGTFNFQDDFYIVKAKDELRNISKKIYNDSLKWKKIYNANRDIIKNPDKIYPGQKLKIPE